MTKKHWYGIGLMSGTSLDGLDLVYTQITKNKQYSYKIIATETFPYSNNWRKKLQNAFTSSALEITRLNTEYGKFLGKITNTFIKNNNISKLDFIASHGHTIFHKPGENYTLQIGDGATLAQTCKQTVVCDFRTQDVAKGGQGAPLVPIGDSLFFSAYDYCINIGGFANISFDDMGVRKAFDICPANIILNHYTGKIALEYDDKGLLAKSGEKNNELLTALNNLPLYKKRESLGYEIIISDFIPLIDSFNLSIPDILRTVVEHIAIKIAQNLSPNTQSLITGGGALNNYLIERIKFHTKSTIIIPSRELIDYKEALIFSLLGLLRLQNKVNVLASVTGADKNHSSGVIYYP
jgi:anhydro-N-acetylmuramic acid kinase